MALVGGATSNLIGGTGGSGGNLVEYNKSGGVFVQGAGTASNVVEYNVVASNIGFGVYIDDAPGNSVLFCTIEYNSDDGILTENSATILNGDTVNSNRLEQIVQV